MSMTEQGVQAQALQLNPLRQALNDFNLVFDYDLRLPALPEHILTAADLAEMRGRTDIAENLRLALKQALGVDE